MEDMEEEIMDSRMRDWFRKYLLPVVLAVLQWGIWQLFNVGRGFLMYDPSRLYTWVQKGMFLIFLLMGWCFAFYVARGIREGNRGLKRGLQVFSVYFAFLMIMLLLLWPGTWQWDDIGVLASARHFDLLPWQHVLSSFFQNIFIQLIPTPGGVILVQLVIAALIVSYALTDFEMTFCDGKLLTGFWPVDTLIKLLPFLLPPVVLYQYSGFRMGMYIFYEVFVLSFIICASYRKRQVSYQMLLIFGLCAAVISTWRSEGFLYAPAVIALILMHDGGIKLKHQAERTDTETADVTFTLSKKLFTIAVMLIGIVSITSFQKTMTENDNYSIVAFLRPLSEVVRASDPEEDADLLQDIGKVITLDPIYEYPDIDGENLLWKYDLNIYEYTDEEYSAFFKAFIQLCKRHPKAVAKERIRVFIETSAIHGRTNPNNTVVTYYLYDPEEQNENEADFVSWDAPFNRPLSESARQKFVLFLGWLHDDFSERVGYRLVWDTIIPILILTIIWIYLLLKKSWKMLIGLSAVVLRIPIVFITAPATWTMYYLSFYLLGYVAAMCVIVKFIMNIRRKG